MERRNVISRNGLWISPSVSSSCLFVRRDGTGRCVSTSPHVVAVVMPVQASCDSRASHCNIEVLQHMYSRGRQGGGGVVCLKHVLI